MMFYPFDCYGSQAVGHATDIPPSYRSSSVNQIPSWMNFDIKGGDRREKVSREGGRHRAEFEQRSEVSDTK